MKTILSLLSLFTLSHFAHSQDSASYFFNKGKEEKEARRFQIAYQQFQKALAVSPARTEFQKEAGLVAFELRRYDVARNHFEKVYQQDKNDATVIAHLAQLNFSLRRWPEAIEFAQMMKQKQIGSNYNYILGKSFYEQENYGESYKYLQAAAKDDPRNAEIPYLQARSFVDMSNYKMAVKFFNEAIALDSTKANWIYEAGLTYFAIPDAKSAIRYFETAIAKGYKATNDVMENLSNAYIEAGQPQKGIELLKQLLEKKPADMELLWNIAEAHFKQNKFPEAIEYWDRILYFDKDNARALYMIGLSYIRKGDKAKGEQLCDRAISMDPSLKNLKQKKELPTGL